MAKINVQNTEITIVSHNDDDYISLTDMARSQLQEHIIFRWLSLKSTIEYLGEWEMLYNPNFNCTEFGTFRNMAECHALVVGEAVKVWSHRALQSYHFTLPLAVDVVAAYLSADGLGGFALAVLGLNLCHTECKYIDTKKRPPRGTAYNIQ